jgi:hypothetical protein
MVQLYAVQLSVRTDAGAKIDPERLHGFDRLADIFSIQSASKENRFAARFDYPPAEFPIVPASRSAQFFYR